MAFDKTWNAEMANDTPFPGANLRDMQELVKKFGITIEVRSEPDSPGTQQAVWKSRKEMKEEQKKKPPTKAEIIMILMGENQGSALSSATANGIIDALVGESQEMIAKLEKEMATHEVKCFEKDTWGKHPGNTEEKKPLTIEYLMAWCTEAKLAQIAITEERKQKYIEDNS